MGSVACSSPTRPGGEPGTACGESVRLAGAATPAANHVIVAALPPGAPLRGAGAGGRSDGQGGGHQDLLGWGGRPAGQLVEQEPGCFPADVVLRDADGGERRPPPFHEGHVVVADDGEAGGAGGGGLPARGG